MELFKKIIASTTATSPASGSLFAKGNALRKERRFDEAFECYGQALAADPRNGDIWRAVAETQAMNFKYPEAMESCDQALKLNPVDTEAWFLKGFTLQMQGRFQDALECTGKILEINPNHIQAWCNQGEYFYALGKLEEALECFSKAIQIDPESQYAREVDEKIRKWLSRDGKDDAWINDIISFLQAGNYQQALDGYQEALEVDPRSVDRNFNKDYALKHLEKPEQIREEYLKAKRDHQAQVKITLSEKEFEFGRETWVDLTLTNIGNAPAMKLTYQFPAAFRIKHKEISAEAIKLQKADPNADITFIPDLGPGSSLTRTIAVSPSKLGDMTIDITVRYSDTWGTNHVKTVPVWVSVIRAGKQVPNIPGFNVSWRMSTSETADIYAARTTKDDIVTVIKMLRVAPEQTGNVKELVSEISLWGRLKHPNIVRVYQYGDQPGLWLSLEYMAKGSLTQRIGQLNVVQSLKIAAQLTDALIYAKKMSATHRYLSSDNILFDENQVPKITNWRIANVTRKMAKKKDIYAYMAPEQVSTGFGGADWRTDIYQMGILLFQMLTGDLPFKQQNEALTEQIVNSAPAKPSTHNRTVLPVLDAIVLKCLAKNKADRQQDAATLKAQLDQVIQTYIR